MLKPLHEGSLEAEDVRELARDIGSLCSRLVVVPRSRAPRLPGPADLDVEVDALLRGELRGLQLRYAYAGEEWWDTLLPTGEGFRLVRISHG